MATKSKQQNGTAQETAVSQPLDLATAQQMLQAAERERRERFQVEYERLCNEYGYEIAGRPAFSNDGRVGVMMEIRKRNQ